jgi:TonB-dependent starch-binding outer membrane protein SusC
MSVKFMTIFPNQTSDYRPGGPVTALLRAWKVAALLVALISVLAPDGYAQNSRRRISGTVSDTDGQPLPGVNVVIKGTTTGTTSNLEGLYNLDASDADVLVFSYIGYQSAELRVGSQTRIDVKLTEDIATLSEVVVVGYGEMKRTDISSAQTSISAKEIQSTVNTTLEQAIQGRAAGVYVTQNTGQPGGGISVNIRGINSLNGSNEPLYVIDGVQIAPGNVSFGATSSTNPLAGLNPADIESMEILQGPSATAIYGSRATNGVVLITTKRGKAGEMKVSYDYLYSLQDKPNILPTMNLRQFAQMTNEIRTLTGGMSPTEFRDPSILGEGTNWQRELFRRAPLNKHQLSLSGGSEKTTFYLSGEYFDQKGVAEGSGFDRYGIRLNVDNQTRSWLKLGTNLNFSRTNEALATTQENIILNALSLAPNIPVRNPDGSWGGADATNGNNAQYTPLNPIAIANLVDNNLSRTQVLGGFNVDVNLIKGLTFRTSLNGNVGFNNGSFFTPSYRLGDRVNDMARLTVSKDNSLYWNWLQLLQYNTTFGRHNIGVMLSHEAQESRWERLEGYREGFVTNEIPDLSIGNTLGATNNGGKNHWAMESYFGRVNYTFADKYILQGAVRADGSANFGPQNRWGVFPSVSAAWRISQEPFMQNIPLINDLKLRVETGLTGNQGSGGIFAPLQSVSTPWGAGFLAQRYGNAGLQWESTLTNNIGFNLNMLQNRIQLEADFYVKNTDNLLMTNPLPDYMGTSGEGSIGAPTVNIGAMDNRGYAITLNTINMDRGDFVWRTNFNISGFRTKITKFYSEAAIIDRTSWFMNNWTQRSVIGQAPWLFFGYIQDGIFESVDEINNSAIPTDSEGNRLRVAPDAVWVGDVKYRDLNNDGVIDERDQTFIGNPWPRFSFGFTNTVSYKGFELNVLLTGSFGNDVYNYLRFINTNPNNINLGRNLLQETFDYARVEGEGEAARLVNPGTDVPRITGSDVNGNGQRFTDKFVEDGSYIRIKSVQLGYTVPRDFLVRQSVIQGARLAIGVQNLATFTRYKGYDPEVGAYVGRDVSAANQSIGLDFGRYPLTPVYTFSVGLDF